MFVCSRSFLFNSIFYYMAQQCPGRKGFSPGALMSCFLSFPKWCPTLRNSPVSVLVVWMYIRVWQIHSALFGNFSGTELNKSESDSKLMEPEWQLDANPVLLDPFMNILLRDSSVWAQLLHRRNDLAERKSPVSPNQEWSKMRLWCCDLKIFRATISKILPKLAKGLYLLIKGCCPLHLASPTSDTQCKANFRKAL